MTAGSKALELLKAEYQTLQKDCKDLREYADFNDPDVVKVYQSYQSKLSLIEYVIRESYK
jgi:hypothetical protein